MGDIRWIYSENQTGILRRQRGGRPVYQMRKKGINMRKYY
jgi:hypothetical protein